MKQTRARQRQINISLRIVNDEPISLRTETRHLTVLLLAVAAILIILLFAQLLAFGPRAHEAEAASVENAIGATVEPLDSTAAATLHISGSRNGLVVTSVSKSGPSAQAGIHAGDIIERVEGKRVRSLGDAAVVLSGSPPPVTITLRRQEHYANVQVQTRAPDRHQPQVQQRTAR
jgi:S1-C subfamily serine protease